MKFYEETLRKYHSAIIPCLALFGNQYNISIERAAGIAKRGYLRTEIPLLWGQYVICCYKITVALSGAALTYGLILLLKKLPNGQLTVEITIQCAPFFLSLLIGFHCAFVFIGAMEISLKTILFCAACDEEMFIGEQRFMEEDLKSYLDLIAEEQTDQMREYGLELGPARKNKISAMEEQEGVVLDEDWHQGILQMPSNPLRRNNYRPIYQPGTPSTQGHSAATADQTEQPNTMRANQAYIRPADIATPAILLTPASSVAWEHEAK